MFILVIILCFLFHVNYKCFDCPHFVKHFINWLISSRARKGWRRNNVFLKSKLWFDSLVELSWDTGSSFFPRSMDLVSYWLSWAFRFPAPIWTPAPVWTPSVMLSQRTSSLLLSACSSTASTELLSTPTLRARSSSETPGDGWTSCHFQKTNMWRCLL